MHTPVEVFLLWIKIGLLTSGRTWGASQAFLPGIRVLLFATDSI